LACVLAFGALGVGIACGTANHGAGFADDADASGEGDDGTGGPQLSDDASDDSTCVGLQCAQVSCTQGGTTTVTGTVFAPNGTLPIYNAIVYVPNGQVQPMPHGATCDVCGAPASGNPLVATLSNADGTFKLENVPAGSDIPLVIQLGRWRRQVVLPTVAPCTENAVTDANLTRLPKSQSEGDLPRIALTTGGCDKLGCMLPKIGVAASEFGVESSGAAKSVHVFLGAGGGGPPDSGAAQGFWDDLTRLKNYDMVLLSCECQEHLEDKGTAAYQAITEYLAAGGRIFTTDFMYDWYKYTPDPGLKSVSNIKGGAPPGGNPVTLDTSFPKGMALSDWLKSVFPTSPDVQSGQVRFDVVFANLTSVDSSKAQIWARSGSTTQPTTPPEVARIFTVNMPVGVPVDQQCGKGVHIDAHVNQGGFPTDGGIDTVSTNYPAGCVQPLKEGEATLAFFFFDLASCIQNDGQPPPPPSVK
jgi:hypothetical protein